MSCITKIKNCKGLTKTEEKIAEYIAKNVDEVIYDSAQILSKKIKTSPAALIRFSKKLGYKGFTDLKLDLAQEDISETTEDSFDSFLCNHDTLDAVIKKKATFDLSAMEQTFKLLHKNNLLNAIKHLQEAQKIYLFGISASGICCQDLAQKLSRIGYNIIFFNDMHMQLAATSHIRSCDVALAISYSGHTREVNIAMEHAKKAGAKTIAITQINNSPLQKLTDILLFVPTYEKDFRLGAMASRNSSLILTDLLYLGLIKDDLDEFKSNLKKSRNLVRKLHD